MILTQDVIFSERTHDSIFCISDVAPPVPVKDLFALVNFSLVRWDLILEILPTWVGMVFVVSFASCLDVAAISMDMGEALDTNKELATVGIGNLMSGKAPFFLDMFTISGSLSFRNDVPLPHGSYILSKLSLPTEL